MDLDLEAVHRFVLKHRPDIDTFRSRCISETSTAEEFAKVIHCDDAVEGKEARLIDDGQVYFHGLKILIQKWVPFD